MDGLLSVALAVAILPSSILNVLTGRLAGSQRAEIDPNCLTLTKCYSRVACILYTLGVLSMQTVKPLSYLLPYSQRSIALVKRLAGSPKAEIDPNLLLPNKVLLGGTFLYTWMDFFRRCCQAVYFLPYSERSVH
jgi:hypothetical protein